MSTFPTSRPTYAGFTSSHTLAADNHAAQHNAEQADISALSDKVGLGSSTPTNQKLLRGNGTGTSTWAQADLTTDVTGVLPVANGGNGTTATTGTGSAVFGTAPTLSNPTITGGTTTDTLAVTGNETVGGTLAVTGGTTLNSTLAVTGTTVLTGPVSGAGYSMLNMVNPYKFSAYLSSDQAVSSSTVTKCQLNTKQFDTGSNFDNATNYRFTAPVAGFYFISAQLATTVAGAAAVATEAYIYKNGVEIIRGTELPGNGTGGQINRPSMNRLLQLAANDYIELYGYVGEGGRSFAGGSTLTFITGFLVSAT